jgi:hypothetical protein
MPFKIVSEKHGILRSYAYWIPGNVIYETGKWTIRHPFHGPLTCFQTMDDAKRFALENTSRHLFPFTDAGHVFRLFTCEAEQSEDVQMWVPGIGHQYPPIGTILSDKIMLIAEIKETED